MKIKVCGLKQPDNIEAIIALQPDYMGFICYGISPRFIADLPVDVLDRLPQAIQKTGVFVNDSLENISLLIKEYNFDAVQLHGYENPEFCEALKKRVTVLKAFGVDEGFDFEQLNPYAGKVDYFLFDTKTPKHGGSGLTFNWDILDKYKMDLPFFLSGGLSPDNIEQVLQIKHPQFYGVDLNSRFETAPGVKDIEKLSKAFELLRQSATNEI
ncbi:phosphoribosylanthranilate isomerase [Mucilaginibacter polytrichastri]|uniref:N-(5'-phosphoribosyl)anthranilate isomerase n=1 Tax=Mucilaginibacter polytrichastri TaxID=1302689 RepID=A0A1Q5ZX52_9SPHI|nr:phosphoribosylanthranilate isomerase [Mucilaginibacter polytrichastri]OKS86354.1 N-(5'-phosphoribosyl)anthranilate isomerase [Mucilaginibacter polytrichastri]SFT20993.1 phosphoribosylanthranilate isomerase [Mucilaginibacter polytrichastri]